MTKKRRVSYRLDDNEAIVVGTLEQWAHLIETYENLASWYPEHADKWNGMAEWIRKWVARATREKTSGEEDW